MKALLQMSKFQQTPSAAHVFMMIDIY